MKKFKPILTISFFLIISISTKAYSVQAEVIDTTLQALSPFPFGGAISIKYIEDNIKYRTLVINEYSSITPIGAMKMTRIRPTQDRYDFTDADYMVNFAEQYGKRIHGHVLLWGKVPEWLNVFQGDSATWENIMKEHIHTVVGRYRGRVEAWDVVNEAIDDNGNIKPDNIWTRNLGEGYIERAFIYAHEADPDALLFYNDYGHEYSNKRLNAITQMLIRFKEKGIPVHGIGLQMHTRYNLGDERWKNAMEISASTGLKVHVSELDISVNPEADQNAVFTPELAEEQRRKYKFFVEAYNSLPEEQKYGITTWGIGDKDTWIRGSKKRPEWPLPFDDDYERKPAYYGIIEGFGNNTVNESASLIFENALSGYPSNYTFSTGDIMYFSQGRNSSTSGICAGSEGIVLSNRVQEHTFILELRSKPVSTITIYGKSSSTAERVINKIEISSSKEGNYTDITQSVDISNSMRYGNCGTLKVSNLNIQKNTFVKIHITLPDGVTSAPTNISEIQIEPALGTSLRVANIEDYKTTKTEQKRNYYNILGSPVHKSATGVVIEKIIYTDGSCQVNKIIKQK